MRRCIACNEERIPSEFLRQEHSRDGRGRTCIECLNPEATIKIMERPNVVRFHNSVTGSVWTVRQNEQEPTAHEIKEAARYCISL